MSIRPRGARAERLAEWRDWCRTQVRLRCGVSPFLAGLVAGGWPKGTCEGCGKWLPLDWAHLFGRRNVIGEPWCSLPELTVGLCRVCHTAIDERHDDPLLHFLRWQGLYRLAARWPVLAPVVEAAAAPVSAGPVACVRQCERVLASEVQREELPDFAPSWKR